MSTRRTPRQLAREANLERIKDLALSQLARDGAGGLSLRAIARELDLVSSAIYRYYASRDELVTDLILDAYDDLAEHVTRAVARAGNLPAQEQWVAGCLAFRQWAVAAPHRYGLVYGSAIPGYAAPRETVEPAARVVRALLAPVSGAALRVGEGGSEPAPELTTQLATAAAALELDVVPETMLQLVAAFARVQGLVGLELNGHFVGGFEPADLLFESLVRREAEGWRTPAPERGKRPVT